jgi:BlaI family transcriptional regulator, penicillinase repressor
MGKRASIGDTKRLTDVELELMTILWRLGEGSVNDVIGELPRERELAYTSVSTILRILETKCVLEARKEGRGHVYVPQFGKADYEARVVRDVVERVFQGVPLALVRQLLDSGELTDTDLREVRKLLGRAKGRK